MSVPGGEEHSKILVTGFGPFGRHSINASWVAVKELDKLWAQQPDSATRRSFKLEAREVPVSYNYISGSLKQIYEEVSPVLCVHVGVSSNKNVKLEKYGRNSGYLIPDTEGSYPTHTQCVQHGPECLRTLFDLEYVLSLLKSKSSGQPQMEFGISENAGRYLCDYIYYSSLYLNACPVVFIHVPPLNKPYSSQQLGQALKDIIEVLLKEINT